MRHDCLFPETNSQSQEKEQKEKRDIGSGDDEAERTGQREQNSERLRRSELESHQTRLS